MMRSITARTLAIAGLVLATASLPGPATAAAGSPVTTAQVAVLDVHPGSEDRIRVSGTIELDGYLQAYWSPAPDAVTGIQEKRLSFRFHAEADAINRLPHLADPVLDARIRQDARHFDIFASIDPKSAQPAYFSAASGEALLRATFPPAQIPESFLRYQEGTVLIRGRLNAGNILSAVDCDRTHYYIDLAAFTPDGSKVLTALPEALASGDQGCAMLPPQRLLIVSAANRPVPIFARPDAGSPVLGTRYPGTTVDKLSTYDDRWIEISLPSANPARGYVMRDQVAEPD
ncbi:hypothetical protein J5J83_01550 [Azoarcus sp. L1K30]|uniref:SH3 domain-containing protein n=1 Tax=Azoarcus sp. L1K30 TaxID=2820277 RepID=UPI001B838051|nr:SH3 domain-containing protein [Azoarcus sp. L1K30]MBR0564799.1 hypothetical protein [Azoarcus sp. L1K30]